MAGNRENPVDAIGITGYSGFMLNFRECRKQKPAGPQNPAWETPLWRRLRRARINVVFASSSFVGDPVLAALAKKGWAFRKSVRVTERKDELDPVSKAQHQRCGALHGTTRKSLVIARGATPLGRPRIARRRYAGSPERRAPFSVEDLTAPLAAVAPNIAGAAIIMLLLTIIL